MREGHFCVQNGSFAPNKHFLGKNHQYYFHLLTDLFHSAKFWKILRIDPEF